jgi:hypothetical protein
MNHQVILQVLPDMRRMQQAANAKRFKLVARPNAGYTPTLGESE